jgi:hypothetical protein
METQKHLETICLTKGENQVFLSKKHKKTENIFVKYTD